LRTVNCYEKFFPDWRQALSDGHGCDAGGHHCGDSSSFASNGAQYTGYEVGGEAQAPFPGTKRVTINGAPVSEASHEYVVGKAGSSNGR
jgi:hypothetical protein